VDLQIAWHDDGLRPIRTLREVLAEIRGNDPGAIVGQLHHRIERLSPVRLGGAPRLRDVVHAVALRAFLGDGVLARPVWQVRGAAVPLPCSGNDHREEHHSRRQNAERILRHISSWETRSGYTPVFLSGKENPMHRASMWCAAIAALWLASP